MVGVGCDVLLLKALMRPDLVVEASGTQDVMAAQRSPTGSNVLDGGRRKAEPGAGRGQWGVLVGTVYWACPDERSGGGEGGAA